MHWGPLVSILVLDVGYSISFGLLFACKLHINIEAMIKVQGHQLFMVLFHRLNQQCLISPTLQMFLLLVFLYHLVAHLALRRVPIALYCVRGSFICLHFGLAIRTHHCLGRLRFFFFVLATALVPHRVHLLRLGLLLLKVKLSFRFSRP